jgi:hypothetical protein
MHLREVIKGKYKLGIFDNPAANSTHHICSVSEVCKPLFLPLLHKIQNMIKSYMADVSGHRT